LPFNGQPEAYNFIWVLPAFFPQDADWDASIHARFDSAVGVELARVGSAVVLLGVRHAPGAVALPYNPAIGVSVLFSGANAESVWHPLRLEDAFELRDQLDAVSFHVVEAGFLADVIFEPLKAFGVIRIVEAANG
jgi:hypothetical protein